MNLRFLSRCLLRGHKFSDDIPTHYVAKDNRFFSTQDTECVRCGKKFVAVIEGMGDMVKITHTASHRTA